MKIHDATVMGVDVDPETRCAHYHNERDIIAIKFKCCGKWFSCHLCHQELVQHGAVVWPPQEFDSVAALCGACGHRVTAREYLLCVSACSSCGRSFNPGCASHAHYYFAVDR